MTINISFYVLFLLCLAALAVGGTVAFGWTFLPGLLAGICVTVFGVFAHMMEEGGNN